MPVFVTPQTIAAGTWGGTANSWVNTVSVSAPSNASAAIFVHSAASGHAISVMGMRRTDSTDIWQQSSVGIGSGGQTMRTIGIDSSQSFNVYPSSVTSVTVLQYIGYYLNTEVVWLQNAFLLTPVVGSTYTAYNPSTLSSGLIPSNALAVIVAPSKSASGTFGLRAFNSSDDNVGSGGVITNMFESTVGLNSGQFQARTNSASMSLYVVGYIPSTAPFTWNFTALSRTPGTANAVVTLNTEVQAAASLYQVTGGINFTVVQSSLSGTGLPFLENGAGATGQILCGAPPTANMSSITAPANIIELGFWSSVAAAYTPFTRTDFVAEDRVIIS